MAREELSHLVFRRGERQIADVKLLCQGTSHSTFAEANAFSVVPGPGRPVPGDADEIPVGQEEILEYLLNPSGKGIPNRSRCGGVNPNTSNQTGRLSAPKASTECFKSHSRMPNRPDFRLERRNMHLCDEAHRFAPTATQRKPALGPQPLAEPRLSVGPNGRTFVGDATAGVEAIPVTRPRWSTGGCRIRPRRRAGSTKSSRFG